MQELPGRALPLASNRLMTASREAGILARSVPAQVGFRAAAAVFLLWLSLPVQAAGGLPDLPPAILEVLRELRNGQYEPALEASRRLERSHPHDLLPHLLAAEAYWQLIYCETGHITSREIWNTADQNTSSYDEAFFATVEEALEAIEPLLEDPDRAATGFLYSGIVRGMRGRLYSFRRQVRQSASEGKRMRSDLLEAVDQDAALAPDAYLGLGSYNYYADVLSPLLKFFRFFLGIPGGDRREGLEQLRTASEQAALLAPEAQFELARILGVREGRHTEAMERFRTLSELYPGNALYALSAAYQAEQAGHKEASVQLVRRAIVALEKRSGPCAERLSEAAHGALLRLSPDTNVAVKSRGNNRLP